MKIGIMGAMTQEIDLLIPQVLNKHTETVGNRTFISGNILGKDIVIVFSRWGKVAASSTATTLIDRFGCDLIVFSGVAGALDNNLNIGDIVIGKTLVQHDMDASALPGFKKFEIPLMGNQFFESPPQLVDKAVAAAISYINSDMPNEISINKLKEFEISYPKVVSGLIASGDQFIASIDVSTGLLALLPDILCVEMEGAAVAQVAVEHGIPFIVLRTISDKADYSAHIDFPLFIEQIASHFTCGSVIRLLETL